MFDPSKPRAGGEAARALERRIRELLAAGDHRAAATEAIRALAPRVLHYLHALLRDEDDAGDAFSVFAEGVWRGLPGFRWEASLGTWGFRLAWNAALTVRDDAWRRHGRRFATGEASRIAEEIRTRSSSRVERQVEHLAKLVAALPLDDRSLIALRIGQALPWAEIAAILSTEECPLDENTLSRRFSRVKERLARMARREGFLGR
jgi:RNA polymerase sigma-70 factor (ECF subfamily)